MLDAQVADGREGDVSEAAGFGYAECGGVRVWSCGGVVRLLAGDGRGGAVEVSEDEVEALIAVLRRMSGVGKAGD